MAHFEARCAQAVCSFPLTVTLFYVSPFSCSFPIPVELPSLLIQDLSLQVSFAQECAVRACCNLIERILIKHDEDNAKSDGSEMVEALR